MKVTYPEIKVRLLGEDGNAFAIIGRVTRAMRNAGLSKAEIDVFCEQAKASASYDELLAYVMKTVDCDHSEAG